jgi:hypothetical protein
MIDQAIMFGAAQRLFGHPGIEHDERLTERQREMRGKGEAWRAVERHQPHDRLTGLQVGDMGEGAGRIVERFRAVHDRLGHAGGA